MYTHIYTYISVSISLSLYIYMYTCIYVYMYICIYVYMYICIFMYIYIYIYMYTCICIYVCVYICVYIYICTYTEAFVASGGVPRPAAALIVDIDFLQTMFISTLKYTTYEDKMACNILRIIISTLKQNKAIDGKLHVEITIRNILQALLSFRTSTSCAAASPPRLSSQSLEACRTREHAFSQTRNDNLSVAEHCRTPRQSRR